MKRLFAFLLALTAAAAAEPADLEKDVAAKYIGDDLSVLMKPQDDFLGFIGQNYQRLFMTFTAIKKDAKDRRLYHVIGRSTVKGNACALSGEIVIGAMKTKPFDADEDEFATEYATELRIEKVGTISAHYVLREDPGCSHPGVFEGDLGLSFDITKDGKLLYDMISDPEGGWANNRYVGTWTPRGNIAASKIANWGDQRIPGDGDLDQGMHAFRPNDTYRKNGWQDYKPKED